MIHAPQLLVAKQIAIRLYYPISLLEKIMSDFPQSKFGILYDIGCQLETHITKVSRFHFIASPYFFVSFNIYL
jgi:hypothetical protein